MERIREAAKVYKLYPKLQLGTKLEKGGVQSTGPHTVKLLAEPTTVMMNKGGRQVKGFKFLVEENGQTFKWLVPLTNDQNEGHYLIDRLNTMNVEVGEEIVLEMKKRGVKNYVEVTRPGESAHEDEVEEEEIDPATIGFDGTNPA